MSIMIKDLSYSYGNNYVLNSITTTFNSGKVTILGGPNGSGKSTLVKILTGIHSVKNNHVYIKNKDINKLTITERSRLIGYVSQSLDYNFDFTVKEIVEMGRYPYKKEWNKFDNTKIINDSLLKTESYNLKDRYISTLSGGELQRVLLSRALAVEPEILILDEPSSNLDISHNIHMMDLLKQITKEYNLTTVMVLHDINTIFKYGDDIRLLKNGNLKISGGVQESLTPTNIKNIYGVSAEIIYDKNRNPYIAVI